MRHKKFLIWLFCCSTLLHGYSQHLGVSPELASRLAGKANFNQIMSEVDQYYFSKDFHSDPKLLSEYKKWNRWAWYAVRHLNELGEVDFNTDEYLDIALRRPQIQSDDMRLSNSGIWSFVGPYSIDWANHWGSKGLGRVDRLAFHPTNANIIYAATPAGGLWRTNDGGVNWFSISAHIPNCGISGIVISEDDPNGNKLFILTGDADSGPGSFVSVYGYLRTSIGVLVSLDGGYTWSKCGNSETLLTGRSGYKLIQVRGLPWRLMVATDNGIYTSNNYGASWSLSELAFVTVFDIEQHPTDNGIFYAASSSTVWKSVNFGVGFSNTATFNPGTSGATRSALAVSPANTNDVYYLQCGSVNTLYRSTDSGDNYNLVNTTDLIGGQYSYNCSMAVNPVGSQVVIGGIIISSSVDNGVTFGNNTIGNISTGPPPSNFVHPDVHDLAYHPVSHLLYAATDGGVFMSSDQGINWTERSNGLTTTQYYHMDGFDGTSNLMIGGSQDNGTAYTANGATMHYCGAGDGFAVDFVSGDNDVFYNVANTLVFRFNRSTNTRTHISPGGSSGQTFYPSIAAHPTNNSIVYVGYKDTIWRSDNQGASWVNIATPGTSNNGSGHTGGFAVSAASPDRLYAANATTLWRFENQGDNVTTISGTTGWPGAGTFGVITDIACSNGNADEVWVTMTGMNGQNKVFYSSNAGAGWTNYTGTLPNIPVYCITYDDQGDAYIGTELGVYFMDFLMSDWVPFYNGMPLVPVTDLFVNETFGTIQAATFGRGIWQSDLYSDCGPFLLLTGATEGHQFYQSGGFIETTQFVPGSFGNELRLRSPTSITFKPGFSLHDKAYLHAVIGNCGQGLFNLGENPSETAFDLISKAKALEFVLSHTNSQLK